MLKSYRDPNYVFNMEIPDFVILYEKSIEKEIEQKTWEIWLTMLPLMKTNQIEFVSFDEMLRASKRAESGSESDMPESGVYIDQCFI